MSARRKPALRLVDPALDIPVETGPAPRPVRSPYDPSARGYVPTYQLGQPNRCPGCGLANWYVGRTGAECGSCATFLPFGRTL